MSRFISSLSPLQGSFPDRAHRQRLAAVCLIAALSAANDAGAALIAYDFDTISVPGAADSIDVCQPSCPLNVVAGRPAGADLSLIHI